jgi:IS30 family transposase
MSEAYRRCRFWPDCAIHLGLDRHKHFSPSNRAEMIELRRAGWTHAEIAAAFDTRPTTVSRILARETP